VSHLADAPRKALSLFLSIIVIVKCGGGEERRGRENDIIIFCLATQLQSSFKAPYKLYQSIYITGMEGKSLEQILLIPIDRDA
jgi:hypothetical protein